MAAVLIAQDELTDQEIALAAKIALVTLYDWKHWPEFQARIKEIAADIGEAVQKYAIARKIRRVKALDDRWGRMQQVIAERAVDVKMKIVPGGKTGLLTRDIKGVGSGLSAQVVDVYEVDVGLLKELREHEKQAAQELGQWVENHDVTSRGRSLGQPLADLNEEELDALHDIYQAAAARMGGSQGGEGPPPPAPFSTNGVGDH